MGLWATSLRSFRRSRYATFFKAHQLHFLFVGFGAIHWPTIVTFASRSTDGCLKLWDTRRLDAPLAAWGDLPALLPMTGCDFSPDGSVEVVTGTSVKRGSGAKPTLAFFSTHAEPDRDAGG